jgi:hypothetical protein
VKRVRELFDKEYAAQPQAVQSSFTSSSQDSQPRSSRATQLEWEKQPTGLVGVDVFGDSRKKQKLGLQERLLATYELKDPDPVLGHELLEYLKEPLLSDKKLIPFQWWCRPEIRAKYPRLHRMALDILSIPAMSAEPERIFSNAGVLLSPRRARLEEDAVDSSLCLANWGRSSLISLGDHGKGKQPETSEAEMSTFEQVMAEGDDDDEWFREALLDEGDDNGEGNSSFM